MATYAYTHEIIKEIIKVSWNNKFYFQVISGEDARVLKKGGEERIALYPMRLFFQFCFQMKMTLIQFRVRGRNSFGYLGGA